ncbi:helix-turn-helix domain-containing protein [Kitasatospora phosalacinea]|uniref:DUF397 domain-containing protein n=1 Tax=Kitasatospora phosalacinea TaxID=2065 RepID=A0A9W6PIT3_9ACTN|nr:helix-turn-helix domain-containing protein [Kitasatospora phosalacinea]GLW55597.1 hypothetical protein Kpho01_36080 [Kitasatospora phosalacinea]
MGWQEREVAPHRSARHFYGAETRRLRTDRGWAPARLAGEVRFSPSTLSRVEDGDIKVPGGPVLEFAPAAWAAFVTATTAGRFDTA